MIRPHRRHPLFLAFLLHRTSGILLALFLPVHFWVLSLALTDAATFDEFIRFTDLAAVKLAEGILVFLLAVHIFGGLRLMALEWFPWTAMQKQLAAGAIALSCFVSITFLLQVI